MRCAAANREPFLPARESRTLENQSAIGQSPCRVGANRSRLAVAHPLAPLVSAPNCRKTGVLQSLILFLIGKFDLYQSSLVFFGVLGGHILSYDHKLSGKPL